MRLRMFGLLGAIGCMAYAQTGSVAGPSAGYVFDAPAKAVRQIRGIPGAAMMGEALDLGIGIASAEISPRGDLAVATGADGAVHLFRLSNGAAAERAVNNLMTAPAGVVFSPNGTAAALYRADRVQVLKGLPDNPEIAVTFPLARPASYTMETARPRRASPDAIAVSDDAAYVLFS